MVRSVTFLGTLCLVAPLMAAVSEPLGPDHDPVIPKVIYGVDDRRDWFEETNPQYRAWAASVCALVFAPSLSPVGDGEYRLAVRDLQLTRYIGNSGRFSFNVGLCAGQDFRDQPVGALCTGFMVGPDLIATAGHCGVIFDDLQLLAVVFGFVMKDKDTPVTRFTQDQVYWVREEAGAVYRGEDDHAVLRVDRPITAPGAFPLPIRRSGIVAQDSALGMIGHPWGMPLKFSFGTDTRVLDNSHPVFFTTNVDAFKGNSGGPVFDARTGLVEGILVRAWYNDFAKFPPWCLRPFVAPRDALGMEVVRATQLAATLYNRQGVLQLDKLAYQCADSMLLTLSDADLEGAPEVEVVLFSNDGDQEILLLTPTGGFVEFGAEVLIEEGPAQPGDGRLQVAEGVLITAAYFDADNGDGVPELIQASAYIDCTPPEAGEVAIDPWARSARVRFNTGEPATVYFDLGLECGEDASQHLSGWREEHELTLEELVPDTEYFLRIRTEDTAGNAGWAGDDQGCLRFTTAPFTEHLTFSSTREVSGLLGKRMTFTPAGAGYAVCIDDATRFPSMPGFRPLFLRSGNGPEIVPIRQEEELVFPQQMRFPFFDRDYDRIYISRNGNIHFGAAGHGEVPSLDSHFTHPRISVYYTELLPDAQSRVRVNTAAEGVAVTYEDVPDVSGDRHSFQVELYYSGVIRMTWLRLTRPYAVVGLSPGGGTPSRFELSEPDEYSNCAENLPGLPAGLSPLKGSLACAHYYTDRPAHRSADALILVLSVLLLLAAAQQGMYPGALRRDR